MTNNNAEQKDELYTRTIYERINAVMQDVEYVQKTSEVKSGDGKYKAVTFDQLVSVARKSLVKNRVLVIPETIKTELVQLRDLQAGIKQHFYSGDYNVHFINVDDPANKITIPVNAHGLDSGDKAPGKALTYAVKNATLKLLFLETGENEESRAETAEKAKYITPAQVDIIKTALGNNSERIAKFLEYYTLKSIESLPVDNFNTVVSQIKKQNAAIQQKINEQKDK